MSKWTKVYTLEGVTDFYADDDFEDALREVFGDETDLSVKVRITVENDDEAASGLSALRERVEAKDKALRLAEWGRMTPSGDWACPVCKMLENHGHADNCELAAALQAP